MNREIECLHLKDEIYLKIATIRRVAIRRELDFVKIMDESGIVKKQLSDYVSLQEFAEKIRLQQYDLKLLYKDMVELNTKLQNIIKDLA
jgi:hypothetical protein